MKMRLFILVAMMILLPVSAGAGAKSVYDWKKLADGVSYAAISLPAVEGQKTTLHAFQIDPKKQRLDVVTAANELSGSSAEDMALREKAMIVVNGGFFTPDHKSIGLIIKGGREISPLHKTSWWSIFLMNGTAPAIVTPKEFDKSKSYAMALQVGPRLVVGGTIPKLKEDLAARTAVGIARDGKVIIAVTQGMGISLQTIAKRMSMPRAEGGLDCPNAMALDGGGSSQLYAKVKKFNLSIPGLARVTNGLAVFPK